MITDKEVKVIIYIFRVSEIYEVTLTRASDYWSEEKHINRKEKQFRTWDFNWIKLLTRLSKSQIDSFAARITSGFSSADNID